MQLPPPFSSSTGWGAGCAPSLGPGTGAAALHAVPRSLPKLMWFVASSLLSPTPACKDHLEASTCLPALGTLLCCLPESPGSPGPHLQLTKVAPFGGSNHTSVCKLSCYKVGAPGLGLMGSLEVPFGCWNGAGKDSGSLFLLLCPHPARTSLIWTICWDRSWVFCLGHPPNPGDWSSLGPWDAPSPFPSPLVGVGPGGTSAIMPPFLSHLPLELESALYSGG